MTSRDRADFSAHLRLARRHALQRRLNLAALLLFTLALLTWAFSVPLAAQLLIVTVGALTGFALPVRNAQDWSRAWIRSHAGLAYDTALQLGDSVRDEFGLRVTVRAHARTALARMDRPQQQPWWLAGIVLSLLILLLPSLQFNPPWSGTGPPAGRTPPTQQQDSGSMAVEAEDENAVEELQAELEAPQSEMAAQPDSRTEAPAGQAGEAGEGGADSAVLDRFLDHLREQPSETAEAAGSPDSQPGGAEQPLGSRGETAEGEETAAGEGSAAGGSAELQDEAAAGTENQAGAGAENEGSISEPAAAGGEAAGAEDAAGAEAEGRDAAGLQDDSALQAETGGDGDSEQAGVDSGEPGGEGAGAEAGVELPGSEERLSGPRAAPEFLEGDLVGGSSSAGGSVRLPGFSDVELPSGDSASAYGRAAERAVTEGQIPVEYQEIIRDYFRP